MRLLVETRLEQMVLRTLSFPRQGPFSEFQRILIQDGSSFAVKDILKAVFPGRFTKVSPAAVELHVTLDLLSESLSRVSLTPDTFGERAQLPVAGELKGALLLADRGYSSSVYLGQLMEAGAHKEWMSYANQRVFDTANAGIAEGLICAAIGAATVKRFLAHVTQLSAGAEISTRKVAMCSQGSSMPCSIPATVP